ncbi:MAG: T9SS type A sorting domain-containing protein [Cytophagales bacterium]|nr:T9SS type A sorting domain-containing protein [Cytophagales bacterium]
MDLSAVSLGPHILYIRTMDINKKWSHALISNFNKDTAYCPAADFSFTNSCLGDSLQFTDLSVTDSLFTIIEWIWDYADGNSDTFNVSTNPKHSYSSSGIYPVMLIVTNNSIPSCSDTIIQLVFVSPLPIGITDTASICYGDSLFLGGGWQNTASIYYDTLSYMFGCDSVIISTILTIDSLYFISTSANICSNDSIQLPGGNWVNTTGTYFDTLTTITGCDSIIQTNLSVDSAFSTVVNIAICSNDSSQLPGGNWINTAGTYFDTLTTIVGCDSIFQTNLSIDSAFSIIVNAAICSNDSIQLPGGNWVNTAGTYFDTLTTIAGCDSIFQTNLSVDSVFSTVVNAAICSNDSIQLPGGNWVNAAGTYFDTLSTIAGCDSIIQTNLSFDSVFFTVVNSVICSNDSIQLPNGNWINTAGTYFDTLTATTGCDSIITTNLTVLPIAGSTLDTSICQGDSLLAGGEYQTTTGTYYDTTNAANGCDSVITTTLTVNPLPAKPTITPGGNELASSTAVAYQWYYYDTLISGATLQFYTATNSGFYSVMITDAFGCDSISDPVFVDITSVNELTLFNNLIIYPNPNTGEFTVEIYELRPDKSGYELRVYNILGNEIIKFKILDEKSKIDLSSYAKGIYTLKIICNEGVIHKKIVIE